MEEQVDYKYLIYALQKHRRIQSHIIRYLSYINLSDLYVYFCKV